jgi:hypothetical protein
MNALTLRGPATLTRSGASRRRAASLVWKPNLSHVRTVSSVQGDRPRRGFELRPAGAECVPAEDAPSVRITDPGISSNLFNPFEGLSMAKTAPELFRQAAKFVPLDDSLQKQQITQGTACKSMNQRFYTLCEVYNAERQSVPVLIQPNPANQYKLRLLTSMHWTPHACRLISLIHATGSPVSLAGKRPRSALPRQASPQAPTT